MRGNDWVVHQWNAFLTDTVRWTGCLQHNCEWVHMGLIEISFAFISKRYGKVEYARAWRTPEGGVCLQLHSDRGSLVLRKKQKCLEKLGSFSSGGAHMTLSRYIDIHNRGGTCSISELQTQGK